MDLMPRRLTPWQCRVLRSKLDALGVDTVSMSPSEMDAFVQKQIAADALLVKAAVKTH